MARKWLVVLDRRRYRRAPSYKVQKSTFAAREAGCGLQIDALAANNSTHRRPGAPVTIQASAANNGSGSAGRRTTTISESSWKVHR
jgi:hypothetical protein